MSVVTTIVSIILLCGLISLPVIILYGLNKRNTKYRFIVYLVLGLLTTSVLMLIFSWWSVASDEMLLSYYGYDFEGLNEMERYANVNSENVERVKNLEASLSGIGWPLKAVFSYAFYLPYLLIVYLVIHLIRKRKATN